MSIEIDSFKQCGYFLLVDGNAGENQLAIGVSYGQGRHTAIEAVSMSIDMGAEVIATKVLVHTSTVKAELTRIIRHWSTQGITQMEHERLHNEEFIAEILAEHYGWLEG